MRLLVGLGNPGPKYADTRHNFGFLLLDRVSLLLRESDQFELIDSQERVGLGKWEFFRGSLESVYLLWPLTFMNLSGNAVQKLIESKQDPDFDSRRDLLVFLDDLSLPLGRVRVRPKGSPGGHNGLKSIEAHLGHHEYSRLKLGIGRPGPEDTVVEYVLQPFSTEDRVLVEEVLDFCAPEALRWVQGAEVSELSQVVNGWSAVVPRAEEGCAKAE